MLEDCWEKPPVLLKRSAKLDCYLQITVLAMPRPTLRTWVRPVNPFDFFRLGRRELVDFTRLRFWTVLDLSRDLSHTHPIV